MDDASTKENPGKNTVNNMLDFRSPQHLLLEVILVDDASTKENLGKKLGKDTLFIFFCLFTLKDSASLSHIEVNRVPSMIYTDKYP